MRLARIEIPCDTRSTRFVIARVKWKKWQTEMQLSIDFSFLLYKNTPINGRRRIYPVYHNEKKLVISRTEGTGPPVPTKPDLLTPINNK